MLGFTGIALPNGCGRVIVYAANNLDAFEVAAATSGALPSTYKVVPVKHDLVALDQEQASLMKLMPAYVKDGNNVKQYWPDMATGVETVALYSASAAQLAKLAQVLPSNVRVEVTPSERVIPTALADRNHHRRRPPGETSDSTTTPWAAGPCTSPSPCTSRWASSARHGVASLDLGPSGDDAKLRRGAVPSARSCHVLRLP